MTLWIDNLSLLYNAHEAQFSQLRNAHSKNWNLSTFDIDEISGILLIIIIARYYNSKFPIYRTSPESTYGVSCRSIKSDRQMINANYTDRRCPIWLINRIPFALHVAVGPYIYTKNIIAVCMATNTSNSDNNRLLVSATNDNHQQQQHKTTLKVEKPFSVDSDFV